MTSDFVQEASTRPPSESASRALSGARACILAGGLGLRLRSVISDRPKGLAPIAGRPFLDYLLRQLAAGGLRDVTICSGFGSAAIGEFVRGGEAWDMRVDYSEEPEPLGTGGALRLAMERFQDSEFFVLNGDSFFDIRFDRLLAAHRSSEADATLAVKWVDDPGRFGSVVVDDGGRVTAFREKAGGGPALINGGIYLLNRQVLRAVPLGRPISMEREVFPRLIRASGPIGLAAARFDGWFTDIGVPDDYASLNADPTPIRSAIGEAVTC